MKSRQGRAQASQRGLQAPRERWQHGAEPVPTAAGGQQVARPVLALQRSGKIGPGEVAAAERLYSDYALGVCGARDSGRTGGGGGVQEFSASMLDAMTRYRRARDAVGHRAEEVLRAVVVDETSLKALAAAAGVRTDYVCGMVVAALQSLADHYASARPARGSVSA